MRLPALLATPCTAVSQSADILAFLNITRAPRFVHLSPFMIPPFMMGNIIITYFLRAENSNRMYFHDLFGATCGLFLSIALGFIGTAFVGAGCYACALILFAVYTRRKAMAFA
jgi:hypothetical protein